MSAKKSASVETSSPAPVSGPRYTDQQAAAILTQGVSIGLSAGAGCGKTFVLTQRFLKQLEPGPDSADLASLVAITFTDRAAREMRDRVREAGLQRLQSCADDEVAHWLGVLRGLDTARISTIHSFCNSLLRANAVEAGLDPRFVLLEPPLADALMQSAAQAVIHERLIADDPDAVAYVIRFGLEATRSLMATLARQQFRVDWDAPRPDNPKVLAAVWLQRWLTEYVPKLVDEFRNGATAATLRMLLAEQQPDHPVMLERWQTLAASLNHSLPWTNVESELQQLRDAARVQGGGTKKNWASEAVHEQVKTTLTDLRKEIDGLLELLEINLDDVRLSAEFACHGDRLVREVALRYETLKHQSGKLDFDDLLLKTRQLLRDHPEVCRRFSRNIRLLMVDEFQDTDPVQAEIVRALCGEALRAGKLFLVGDIKQSIYRFRRADPQVFQSLRNELPDAGRLSLTANFRSQPAILHFVNALFSDEFTGYEWLEPFRNEQLSPVPAIEFLWASYDDELSQPDSAASAAAAKKKLTADDLRTREANWIARRISELLADETPRIREKNRETGKVELRRIRPGDITILFRALTSVQEYEAALRDYGLDYYLVGGKAFFAQQEVFDLLNLCRCLALPDDVVSLIGILRSPMFGLSDDSLHALFTSARDDDWWNRLRDDPPAFLPDSQRQQIRFAGQTLHELKSRKDQLPIAELLQEAIARTGYDAALLAEFLGSRKVANLRKLIDQAAAFDRSDIFTLQHYIERLEESVLEQTDEEFATTLSESGDVIRLMSIHQSKGLEFPVVIVADINRQKANNSIRSFLHSEWGALVHLPKQFGRSYDNLALRMLQIDEQAADLEETQRLFYVAVTRAADHLILSAAMEADSKFSPWMSLLASRFQLDTGLASGDPLLATTVGVTSRGEIPEIFVHRIAPEAKKTGSRHRTVPLDKFHANLVEATPQPLPESMRVFGVDEKASRSWSVSALELVDAELNASPVPQFDELPSHRWTAEAAENAGTLVHAALELLEFTNLGDWPRALATAVRAMPVEIPADIQSAAAAMVERFAVSALGARCQRAQQVFREIDFLLPLPWDADGDVISGQIDLCLQTAEGAWEIYDFKTSSDRGLKHDADLLSAYSFQLGLYALAMESWLEGPIDRVSLVLLRPGLREVPFAWTEAERQRTQKRLRQAMNRAREG